MADVNWGLTHIGSGFFGIVAPGNLGLGQDIGAIGGGKFLKSISCRWILSQPATPKPRVAVYQGGVLDNPTGATLLYDFGKFTVNPGSVPYWETLTIPLLSRPPIAQNTMTWIVVKDQNHSSGQIYRSESNPANWDDFVGAAGPRDTLGISSDANAAFEASIPGAGVLHTPASQWPSLYLTYSDDGPPNQLNKLINAEIAPRAVTYKTFKTVRAQVTPADANQRFVYVLDSDNPEALLAKQLRDFMETMGYSDIFPNFDKIRIGTIHPFSILLAQQVLDQPKNVNVFPSVTINDSSMDEDTMILGDDYYAFSFTPEDVAKLDGYRQAGEVFVSDAGWQKIVDRVNDVGFVVGIRRRYHTQHTMDFNVWSENKDITSFLFDMVSHFITQKRVDVHNQEGIDLAGINGRRSGDINLDFGMLLYGANIRAQASINHEATLFDLGVDNIASIDVSTLPNYFISGGQ